jgi:hypothetical protein
MTKKINKTQTKSRPKALVAYDLNRPASLTKFAVVLRDYIVKNNLSVKIAGKDYVMVEGWQFAGGALGILPRIAEVQNVGTRKWQSKVEIVDRAGRVVSTGFALCSAEEGKKKDFDEYAILSMAQTRAIGKAYRNLIGWIVKLAGYEPTPAEEIKGKPEGIKPTEQPAGKVGMVPASEADKQRIVDQIKKMGMRGRVDEVASRVTGIKVDWFNMTKTQASRVLFALMEKAAKK